MRVEIYTSRDRRNGEPLNVERDGYKYEYPDIPVEVELDYKHGEWEVPSAKVMEDLPLVEKFTRLTEAMEYFGVNKRFYNQVEWIVPDLPLKTIIFEKIPHKFLFRKGQEIELDDKEFNEAIDRAETIHRDWKAEPAYEH